MGSFNILFTSAGRRVSLLRSFRRSLEALGLRGNIVTADISKSAPASFVADIRELVPPVVAPGYIEALKAICRKRRIKLVVPLIDTELSILADLNGRVRCVVPRLRIETRSGEVSKGMTVK